MGATVARDRRDRPCGASRRGPPVRIALLVPDRPRLVDRLDRDRLRDDQVPERDRDGVGLDPCLLPGAASRLADGGGNRRARDDVHLGALLRRLPAPGGRWRTRRSRSSRWSPSAPSRATGAGGRSRRSRLRVVSVEVRHELVCAGAAWAIAAAWLWFFGPRARRIRSGWSRGDKAGAALLAVGAFVVVNRVVSPHAIEWTIVSQNYRHRMWTLGLEAGSALTIGLGILPVIAGLAALWLPERRDDPRWRAFAAFFGGVDPDLRPLHGREGGVPLDGLRDPRRGTQPDLPRPADPDRRRRVYFSARRPSGVALAASTVFVGWLVLGYGYQLDFPYFEAPGYGIVTMANRSFSLGPADDPDRARRRVRRRRCGRRAAVRRSHERGLAAAVIAAAALGGRGLVACR